MKTDRQHKQQDHQKEDQTDFPLYADQQTAPVPLKSKDDPKEEFPEEAWDTLSPELAPERRKKLLETVAQRTDLVRLILQDVDNPHNVSACMRTAEALGITHVEIVTLGQKFRPSTVARGVSRWIQYRTHRSAEACASELHRAGFKIAGAVPAKDAYPIRALNEELGPIALLFGNEHEGLSPAWDTLIDQKFTIPMVGLVNSLNISVSAAISLECMTSKLRGALSPEDYHLSQPQQRALLNRWVCLSRPNWPKRLQALREANDPKKSGA